MNKTTNYYWVAASALAGVASVALAYLDLQVIAPNGSFTWGEHLLSASAPLSSCICLVAAST